MGLVDSNSNIFVEEFRQTMAIMNLMAIAQFLEVIYISIFKYYLIARSI